MQGLALSLAMLCLGIAMVCMSPRVALAQMQPSTGATPAPISLYVGQAHVLNERDVRRIAVGNGKVIQATALDDRQLLVLPEAPGQSTLMVWGKSGPERTYVFNVMAADTARLLTEVQAMLGTVHGVTARVIGDKVLVEGSEIGEEQSARIAEIARRYPQVMNLVPRIGMERMIAMDVKFVEVRRELLEDLGVKWAGSAQGPSFQVIGDAFRSKALQPGGAAQGTQLEVRPRIWPFAGSLSIASSLASRLNFLVQQGDAVILAEPRLSCRSGGSARFVAGGELPIPITGALGTASVAFKEYGIKFDVSPQASESGVIAAKIATEISAINFEIAVKDVPGLTKRRAETEVNLRDSETLVIAGLLTDESARNMDRVAGASELPVLGPLFRSRQFRDRQTELVVFITPRFVQGTGAGSGLATDEGTGGAHRTGASAETPSAGNPGAGSPGAGSPAATLDVLPMREPTRFLKPTTPSAPGEPVYEGAPVPASPLPAPQDVDGSRQPASPARALQTTGEDRGTVQRYRVNRERLRMVE